MLFTTTFGDFLHVVANDAYRVSDITTIS